MTQDEERMLREYAAGRACTQSVIDVLGPMSLWSKVGFDREMRKAVKAERDALELELLKLKQGVAANNDYIQGRWDLIGEFQDIIRARGEA